MVNPFLKAYVGALLEDHFNEGKSGVSKKNRLYQLIKQVNLDKTIVVFLVRYVKNYFDKFPFSCALFFGL